MSAEGLEIVIGLLREIARRGYVLPQDRAFIVTFANADHRQLEREKAAHSVCFDEHGYPVAGPLGDDCHGSLWRRAGVV